MYKESKSQKDDAECVLHLVETCTSLIEKYKYPDNDTRTVSLVNIRLVSYASLGIANLLDSWSKGDQTVQQIIPQLLGLTEVNAKAIQLMGNSLHKTLKLSQILLGQFQIEHCIVNICNVLGIRTRPGFYNKANALLTFLGLNSTKLDTLNTGAQIRNSLHSNGIHHGYNGTNFHSNLKGVQYDFIHGQKVSCATFPHIVHALECSVEVLDEIFSSHPVKSHNSLIPDTYAMIIGLGGNTENEP